MKLDLGFDFLFDIFMNANFAAEMESYLLRPHVAGGPRSCQMDGRTISINIGS